MVHSFSSSSESNLSLSVGYFPCEDTFCENTLSCEDSSSEGPSSHFVPPIQGSWRTENPGRLLARRDQIQDGPQQLCKLSITLAWDVDVASNKSDSTANCDLSGDNKDKHPKEKTQMTLSKLDGLVQKLEKFLENQNDDKDDDSVLPESAQEEDSQLPSSSLPGMAQIISEATGSQGTDIAEISSVLSGPQEEDTHSSTEALSCLNFRWVFRWLRHQVLSSLLGREDPKKATEHPRELAQKKRFSHRSKRIQPQETLELHPIP
uniref:Chromosome 12 open reading frame 71 n=1 Tax=Moschus moschiferus TaxID=68415 RepID=A0A8C6G2B9_MOSMO